MAPWVTGVKTGHTFGALYVLVGSGRRKGVELISVAIGAPTDEAPLRRQPRPARLRLRAATSGACRFAPGQELADPSIRYAGGELPLRAARTVAVGVRRDQRLTVAVRAPAAGRGADSPRRRARLAPPSSSTGCAPPRCRLRPHGRCPRRASSTAREASSAPIGSRSRSRCCVILMGAEQSCPRRDWSGVHG